MAKRKRQNGYQPKIPEKWVVWYMHIYSGMHVYRIQCNFFFQRGELTIFLAVKLAFRWCFQLCQKILCDNILRHILKLYIIQLWEFVKWWECYRLEEMSDTLTWKFSLSSTQGISHDDYDWAPCRICQACYKKTGNQPRFYRITMMSIFSRFSQVLHNILRI